MFFKMFRWRFVVPFELSGCILFCLEGRAMNRYNFGGNYSNFMLSYK